MSSKVFYCFQEAENPNEIIELFEKSEYDYHIGYSNPEHMLTVWQIKYFQIKFVIDGSFEQGRPLIKFFVKQKFL